MDKIKADYDKIENAIFFDIDKLAKENEVPTFRKCNIAWCCSESSWALTMIKIEAAIRRVLRS
jgi:hypothetical protein